MSVGGPLLSPGVLHRIARAIAGVRYGSVQIIIQDGRVVQIDKVEKFRLRTPPTTGDGASQASPAEAGVR